LGLIAFVGEGGDGKIFDVWQGDKSCVFLAKDCEKKNGIIDMLLNAIDINFIFKFSNINTIFIPIFSSDILWYFFVFEVSSIVMKQRIGKGNNFAHYRDESEFGMFTIMDKSTLRACLENR